MQYKDKLKDPRWIEFRKQVYKKDKYKCTICGSNKRELHAHHKFYYKGREPWEYNIDELETLCVWCHKAIHGDFGPDIE